MATAKSTTLSGIPQVPGRFDELAAILAHLDDAPVLKKLRSYRMTGRPGYPLRAMWRAYVCSFLLNLPSTNALIRELEDRPDFRIFCGFEGGLPHRTTFNRFIQRLAEHPILIEPTLSGLATKVRALLPDLGKEVAVDSTTVSSNSRPRKKNKEGKVIRESATRKPTGRRNTALGRKKETRNGFGVTRYTWWPMPITGFLLRTSPRLLIGMTHRSCRELLPKPSIGPVG